MNRRNFLKFLGTAVVGTGIVYSFPSIIVPKNISEVYPNAINDFFFQDSSFDDYLRKNMLEQPVFAGIDIRKAVPYYCHRRDLNNLPPYVLTKGEIKVTYTVLDCTRKPQYE